MTKQEYKDTLLKIEQSLEKVPMSTVTDIISGLRLQMEIAKELYLLKEGENE